MIRKGMSWVCVLAVFPALAEQSQNVAPLAVASGQGEYLEAAIDGIKQKDGSGEWIGGSKNEWYGFIHYPSLTLSWDSLIFPLTVRASFATRAKGMATSCFLGEYACPSMTTSIQDSLLSSKAPVMLLEL